MERVRPDPVQLTLETSGRLQTLEDVLHAGWHVVEIVVQDEYTHDVIATRAGEPSWRVFDTT